MTIPIARIDQSLPLPRYFTSGSVAFDLYARTAVKIPPRTIALVPTNVVIQVPRGYALFVAARSSTPLKKGLMLANGIGVIDQDYCGEKDEIKVQVYNFTERTVTVKKEERIAQGILVKIEKAEFKENAFKRISRGGFGTTG
jgi:dUTP pyrophosphatase